MTLVRDEVFKRIEPQGDKWDSVRVVAASPVDADEYVIAPTDPFAGDGSTFDLETYDVNERDVVSISTSEASLRAAYEHVEK